MVPDKNGDKVKIGVFDKVVVEIGVEKVSSLLFHESLLKNDRETDAVRKQDKNTQRGKVVMALCEPVDSRGL
jgi:hypothetical protein